MIYIDLYYYSNACMRSWVILHPSKDPNRLWLVIIMIERPTTRMVRDYVTTYTVNLLLACDFYLRQQRFGC